jgi:transposase
MGKPHPIELRARVIAFVEEGNSHREAARQFRVSPRFVNNMVILKRTSGGLAPARQGHLGGGKLTGHEQWVRQRLSDNGDLTLDELCVELAGRGVSVVRSTASRFLHRLGLSHKKACRRQSSYGRRSRGPVICGSTIASRSSIRHWGG